MEGLHSKAIDQIRRVDVVRELEALVDDIASKGGKGTRANRALAAIKKLFSWCIDQGIVEISPVAGLKPLMKETVRERLLSDAEINAFWTAAGCRSRGVPLPAVHKGTCVDGSAASRNRGDSMVRDRHGQGDADP